ncbi:hypothetical protein [Actinomadura vinacea]
MSDHHVANADRHDRETGPIGPPSIPVMELPGAVFSNAAGMNGSIRAGDR